MTAPQETIATAIQATADLLMDSATREQITVSGDRRVTESDAAKLLGYSAASLKAMRQAGNGPTSYALGMNGGRVSYRIHDLASWIEMARERRHQ